MARPTEKVIRRILNRASIAVGHNNNSPESLCIRMSLPG